MLFTERGVEAMVPCTHCINGVHDCLVYSKEVREKEAGTGARCAFCVFWGRGKCEAKLGRREEEEEMEEEEDATTLRGEIVGLKAQVATLENYSEDMEVRMRRMERNYGQLRGSVDVHDHKIGRLEEHAGMEEEEE